MQASVTIDGFKFTNPVWEDGGDEIVSVAAFIIRPETTSQ